MVKQTIAIYPGRFQPFGKHHHKVYEFMVEMFGEENSFIVTSNKIQENSPLSFQEKKLVISKYGIPEDNIVEVQSPYRAQELIERFDPNTTAVVFIYGEKDASRLNYTKKDGSKGYLQKYNHRYITPLKEHAFVVIAPHYNIKLKEAEMSGTSLRQNLAKATTREFKDMMGWWDAKVYNMFKKKFNSNLTEDYESSLNKRELIKSKEERYKKYVSQIIRKRLRPIYSKYLSGDDLEYALMFRSTLNKKHDLRRGQDLQRIVYDKVTPEENELLKSISAYEFGSGESAADRFNNSIRQKIFKYVRKIQDKLLADEENSYGIKGDVNARWIYHFTTIYNAGDIINMNSLYVGPETGTVSFTSNKNLLKRKPWFQAGQGWRDLVVAFVLDLNKLKKSGKYKIMVGDEERGTVEGEEEVAIRPDIQDLDKYIEKCVLYPSNLDGEFEEEIYNKFIDELNSKNIKWFVSDLKLEQLLNISNILNEASRTNGSAAVDDGPRFLYGNLKSFVKSMDEGPKNNYGWDVINWLLDTDKELENHNTEFPEGPLPAVSFFPSGDVGTQMAGTNYQKEIGGTEAYKKWYNWITGVAEKHGHKLVDVLNAEKSKSIKPIRENLQEGKNIGSVYHYTQLKHLILIFREDKLNASTNHPVAKIIAGEDTKFRRLVSTTRDKNFHKQPREIGGIEVRIELDGDKLSDNYKIGAWDDRTRYGVVDKNAMETYGDEMEDVWYGNKMEADRGIKNITKYIKSIEITSDTIRKMVNQNKYLRNVLKAMELAGIGVFVDRADEYDFEDTKYYLPFLLYHVIEFFPKLFNEYVPNAKITYAGKTDPRLVFEKVYGNKISLPKIEYLTESTQIIAEGGAAKHMNHPFDDLSITFKQLSEMIQRALSGTLDVEGLVQEKLDGQNLMVTYLDGQVRAARNKTTVKNPMSIQQVAQKFEGRGLVKDAFVNAMSDLNSALLKIGAQRLNTIFKGGKRFLNIEIIYPKTQNVIDYGAAYLVFLGLVEFDDDANPVKRFKSEASRLQKIVQSVNADTQQTFNIIAPEALKIATNKNFQGKMSYYLRTLNALRKKHRLGGDSTLGEYYEAELATKIPFKLPPNQLKVLMRRWVYNDNSTKITKGLFGLPSDQIKDFERTKVKDLVKDMQFDFEILFLKLGVDVMSNISGFLTANPNNTVQKIRKDINKIIAQARGSKDPKILKALNYNLKKIKALGGFDAIVPSEGIVFMYNGKLYKLTGAFAPANQLLGLFRYSR